METKFWSSAASSLSYRARSRVMYTPQFRCDCLVVPHICYQYIKVGIRLTVANLAIMT